MARRSKSPLDSGPVKSDLGPETRPARHGRSGLAPPLPHAPRLAPPSSTAGRASPGRGKHLSQPDSLLPARAAHEERLSADLRAALRREAALTKELEALRDAFERLQAELSEARQAAYGELLSFSILSAALLLAALLAGLPLLQVEEALVMVRG